MVDIFFLDCWVTGKPRSSWSIFIRDSEPGWLRMEKSLTDRLGSWWTMSGQPDLGEEALLPRCWSPGRPCAKAVNVLHVRIKVVWQRHRGEVQIASPCQTRPICVLRGWKINTWPHPVTEQSLYPLPQFTFLSRSNLSITQKSC
jgi:hypothetical protein